MDRARGAFAAVGSLAARGARRCSTPSSFVTVMARSGGGSWNGNVMSAFSANRRRILSLWLPRLPIDRIKRQLSTKAFSSEVRTASRNSSYASEKRSTPRELKHDNIPSVVVAKQNNALLITRSTTPRRASGLAVGLPLANARAICPELTVFDADDGRGRQDAQRHRRLVRPLHAAGGARSAAWPVPGHHRLRPSVRRRARAAADRVRRADAARFCRQRRRSPAPRSARAR